MWPTKTAGVNANYLQKAPSHKKQCCWPHSDRIILKIRLIYKVQCLHLYVLITDMHLWTPVRSVFPVIPPHSLNLYQLVLSWSFPHIFKLLMDAGHQTPVSTVTVIKALCLFWSNSLHMQRVSGQKLNLFKLQWRRIQRPGNLLSW